MIGFYEIWGIGQGDWVTSYHAQPRSIKASASRSIHSQLASGNCRRSCKVLIDLAMSNRPQTICGNARSSPPLGRELTCVACVWKSTKSAAKGSTCPAELLQKL